MQISAADCRQRDSNNSFTDTGMRSVNFFNADIVLAVKNICFHFFHFIYRSTNLRKALKQHANNISKRGCNPTDQESGKTRAPPGSTGPTALYRTDQEKDCASKKCRDHDCALHTKQEWQERRETANEERAERANSCQPRRTC